MTRAVPGIEATGVMAPSTYTNSQDIAVSKTSVVSVTAPLQYLLGTANVTASFEQ